jgi:hypothetical protein
VPNLNSDGKFFTSPDLSARQVYHAKTGYRQMVPASKHKSDPYRFHGMYCAENFAPEGYCKTPTLIPSGG